MRTLHRAEKMSEPLALVLVGEAGLVQRALVQRTEQHAVGDTRCRQFDRAFQRVQAVEPAIAGGLGPGEGRGARG